MLYTHICRTTTTTTTATGINFAGARAQNVNVAKRRQAKANPKTKPWLKRPEAGAGQKWVGWWWWPGWDGSESSEGWYGLGQSGSRSMLHLRLKADRNQTEPNWTELSRVELSWVWGKPVYKYSTCTPPICHSTRYPVCLGTHTHPRRRSLFPNPYPDTTHPFGHPQSPYVRVEWIPFLLFAFSSIFFLLFFFGLLVVLFSFALARLLKFLRYESSSIRSSHFDLECMNRKAYSELPMKSLLDMPLFT